MIISLRCLVMDDLRAVLKKDSVVARECDLDADPADPFTVIEVDFGSVAARRIFEASRETSGLVVTPGVLLDEHELEEVEYFQLYGRKVVYESERESSINSYFHDLTDCEEHVRGLETKVLKGAVLSKIRLKPNMAAYLGDSREEFVVGKVVVAAFEDCGLEGFGLLPVLNLRTLEALEGFFQLFTDHVMLPVALDDSTPKRNLGFGEWPHVNLGLLSYRGEDLDGRPDFNRTAEPWGTNKSPLWIVSRRVRRCFNEASLKGWDFLPVLQAGTVLHERYLAAWRLLAASVGSNPANRLT